MDREYLQDVHPDVLLMEPPGMDVAILGLVERCGAEPVLCYSYKKLVEYFESEGMTNEEAREWVDHNVLGAYVGEGTPMILTMEWGD